MSYNILYVLVSIVVFFPSGRPTGFRWFHSILLIDLFHVRPCHSFFHTSIAILLDISHPLALVEGEEVEECLLVVVLHPNNNNNNILVVDEVWVTHLLLHLDGAILADGASPLLLGGA